MRWILFTTLLGAWGVAMLTGNLMGGAAHLLLVAAAAALWFQLANKPEKTDFELWQDKPRAGPRGA